MRKVCRALTAAALVVAAAALFALPGRVTAQAMGARVKSLHDVGVGRVEHQRNLHESDELIQEGLHVGDLIAVGVLQTDVQHLAAAPDLRSTHLGGGFVLPCGDQALELPAPQDVRALADQERPVVVGQLHRLESGHPRTLVVRQRARPPTRHRLDEGRDVRFGGAAAATDQVEPPGLEEAADHLPEEVGALRVLALLVR